MNLNPIIAREVRARWRNWQSFVLVFGYAALLALAMGWRYAGFEANDAVRYEWAPNGQNFAHSLAPRERMAAFGHDLFLTVSWMQTLAWMLIAPALTASTIAGERERGLLEALQLSPLSAVRIVLGKLSSVLFFIALMTLVPLPISAISFLMGGVSPMDFALAFLIQATTALTCAVIGLFCSATSRRAAVALRGAFVFIFIWGASSGLAFFMAQPSWWSRWTFAIAPNATWSITLTAFAITNPVIAIHTLGDSTLFDAIFSQGVVTGPVWRITPAGPISVAGPAMPAAPTPLGDAPWAINILFQGVLALALLWLSVRWVRKPLPEQHWQERTGWGEWLKARLLGPDGEKAARRDKASTRQLKRQARQALLWDLPFVYFIRFKNPVLQREVRGKFRWRRGSLWLSLTRAGVALAAVSFYLMILFSAFDATTRDKVWGLVSRGGLIAVIFAGAVAGASAFTREREAGTWEGLWLSTLPRREILTGKLLAPLIACFYYSAPLWPVVLPCLAWPWRPDEGGSEVPLAHAVVTLLIVTAAGFCYTAWGLLISWLCRRTAVAIGWTLGTIIMGLIFGPLVMNSVPGLLFAGYEAAYGAVTGDVLSNDHYLGYISSSGTSMQLSAWWHPWYALEALNAAQGLNTWAYRSALDWPRMSPAPIFIGLGSVVFLLTVTLALLGLLSRLMQRAVQEKDTRRDKRSAGGGIAMQEIDSVQAKSEPEALGRSHQASN